MSKIIIRLAISLGLAAVFFFAIHKDIPSIIHSIHHTNPIYILLAFTCTLGGAALIARRLQWVFAVQKTQIPYKEVLNSTFIGLFFNNFLPTAVGGDLVKVYCLNKYSQNYIRSLANVLIDRIFGLMTFVLTPAITMAFMGNNFEPWVKNMVMAPLFVSILVAIGLFNPWLFKPFQPLMKIIKKLPMGGEVALVINDLQYYAEHKLTMLKVLLTGLAAQALGIFAVSFLLVALGKPVNLGMLFIYVPMIHLLAMLPSINGLGIREFGFIYFLGNFVGKDIASALAILYLALLLLMSIIGGIIYMTRPDYHFKWKGLKKVNSNEGVVV